MLFVNEPLVPINPTMPLQGRVVVESLPYVFVSSLFKESYLPEPTWFIAVPHLFTPIQQREYVRILVNLPVSAWLINPSGMPENLMINEISGGGLRLVAQQPYTIGTILNLRFNLPDTMIEVVGRVVRSIKPNPQKDIFWIGLMFSDITEQQRNKIVRYIFQKQMEWRRKGHKSSDV